MASSSSDLLMKALLLLCITLLALSDVAVAPPTGITRHYKFDIQMANATRLCHTKSIVTVNGQFPGPKIVAREGDRVVVKVVNHVERNVTLHWHGVRQLRSGWADGPAYVTQCPIQTGHSYVYNFTIVGQRGTFFWHAHISWLRATLYGPIVVLPQLGVPDPFAKPYKEVPVILGEWWKADTEAVISQALQTGGGPNVSDAYTINGLPGPFYNCSAKDTFKLKVEPGKTYLLRLINAALNDELFFGIANHTLTVVDVDAVYVKPFETDALLISPGQTTDVLLRAKPDYPNAMFFMSAGPYVTGTGTFDNSTVAGVLEYRNPKSSSRPSFKSELPLYKPTLPSLNDTSFFAQLHRQVTESGDGSVPGICTAGHRPARLLHRGPRFEPLSGEPDVPGAKRHQVRGDRQQRLLRAADHRPPAGALRGAVEGRLHAGLPPHPADAVQLHRDSAQQHVGGQRDEANGAPLQHQRGACDAGHQHSRSREPPAAPPWLQLLRRGARIRQLRSGEGPGQVQPGGPRGAEHRRGAGRRLGGHPFPGRQPRGVVHALPLGGARELGFEDGVVGVGRKPPSPKAATPAVGSSQM
ncbi:unnamed protein product, partial [Musa textilis]